MKWRRSTTIDDRALTELIVESEDLQVDAMRGATAALPDLAEIAHDPNREQTDARRYFLRQSGLVSSFAAKGLLTGGLGAAVLQILQPTAASAQSNNVDVQILQTAASLENLAVATYQAALGLDFIKNGNKVVKTFAETTMMQHSEHGAQFNAQAKMLGAPEQTGTNPVLTPEVEKAKPTLTDPTKVVELAAMLETVATETYLSNLPMFGSSELRLIMASVMGVESQHLATLRAVGALLGANRADLIAIPTKPAELPEAAGSVSFPQPFENTSMARKPSEGAVQ
jgi:hypothetical protein